MLNNNKNELDWEKERLEAITSYKKDEHIRLLNQKDGNSHFELLHYSIILISQLNWEINNQYFEILKNYVKSNNYSFEFQRNFQDTYNKIEKIADFLASNEILLTPVKESVFFSNLISKIDDCCMAYSDEPEPYRKPGEINEVEFRLEMEKIYQEMKQLLNKA